MRVSFRINGDLVAVDVEPRLHLGDCLRDVLSLTGTHLGCEHGACGACTVIVDGAAVRACLMLTVQVEGASVITVEGLLSDEALSPLPDRFPQASRLTMRLLHPRDVDDGARALNRGARCGR
jgi:aerobic-type carbon monoxide dehydrogenase small subunit (CoxS/CutS family)